MIIKAFCFLKLFSSLLICHGNTFFCFKMLYNIYYMTSLASLPEYFPSVTGKPWSVMSPSAVSFGWHNSPGLSCYLRENILVYRPRSHVIYICIILCNITVQHYSLQKSQRISMAQALLF
jgi:hypothetical protein